MAYQVVITPAIDKAIAKLPKTTRGRVADLLAALAQDPRPMGSIKMSGRNVHRIRVGDYRVLYIIYDQELIVLVVDVGHRREIYRQK